MTDTVFIVAICHGPAATIENLAYRTRDAADAAVHILTTLETGSPVTDDFGTSASIFSEIHSIRTSAIDALLELNTEQQLAAARAQARGQRMAQSDPALNFHTGNGPMIGPNGRM